MKFSKIITDWFKAECGGTLFLPDGWYGRPFDNQHMLTFLNESEDSLTIVLDKKLTLHFESLQLVRVEKNEIIFGPFKNFTFKWESFGSNNIKSGVKEYKNGEVKVIAQPSVFPSF